MKMYVQELGWLQSAMLRPSPYTATAAITAAGASKDALAIDSTQNSLAKTWFHVQRWKLPRGRAKLYSWHTQKRPSPPRISTSLSSSPATGSSRASAALDSLHSFKGNVTAKMRKWEPSSKLYQMKVSAIYALVLPVSQLCGWAVSPKLVTERVSSKDRAPSQ